MKAHGQGGAQPGAVNPGAPGAPMPAGGHAQANAGNPANPGAPGIGPMPGQPGIPGGAGGPGAGGLGGAGPGGAQQFPVGSAEAALAKFCAAVSDSNLTEAAQYISPKAKGLLVQIRDGSMTDEKLESLKASFQSLTAKPSRPVSGVGRTISLTNPKWESLTFTLVKEDDTYLLREFKVAKGASR